MSLDRRTMAGMAEAVIADRKATLAEVRDHADAVREEAGALGLEAPRVREDGTLVVHSTEAGYGAANRLSGALSGIVGVYVHVITDDVPGAASASAL